MGTTGDSEGASGREALAYNCCIWSKWDESRGELAADIGRAVAMTQHGRLNEPGICPSLEAVLLRSIEAPPYALCQTRSLFEPLALCRCLYDNQ